MAHGLKVGRRNHRHIPVDRQTIEGASSVTRNEITREVLVEGIDDWIPVDTLIALARESQDPQHGDFKSLTVSILESLLKQGFIDVGEIGETGFEAWPGEVDEVIAKAVRVLETVEWTPLGGAFWLANTPLGDATAESCSQN